MKNRYWGIIFLNILLCSFLSGCGAKETATSVVDKNETVEVAATEVDENIAIISDIEGVGHVSLAASPNKNSSAVDFNTVDLYGNPVTNDMIKDAKLVFLNLWEPWCGPCVYEMPELNELYIKYRDQGLLIVGAYSTRGMDADAQEIAEVFEIEYPLIKCNKSINRLEQNYVPASYLLDNQGNLITKEPFAGSNSYAGWEAIILKYLK